MTEAFLYRHQGQNMSIDKYNYLWETEKDNWVLVDTEYGYSIINKKEQTALVVSGEKLESALIQQMLKAGNKIFNDIKEAYDNV